MPGCGQGEASVGYSAQRPESSSVLNSDTLSVDLHRLQIHRNGYRYSVRHTGESRYPCAWEQARSRGESPLREMPAPGSRR
jgi:hypothetical protein